jgi:hypothetical protein
MSDPFIVLTHYRQAIAAILETHHSRFRDPPEDFAVNTRILDQLFFLQKMRTSVLAAYCQLGGTSPEFGRFQDTLAEQLQKLIDIPSPSLPERRDKCNLQVLEGIYGSLQELDDTLTLFQNKPAALAANPMAPSAESPQLLNKHFRVLFYLLKNDPQPRLQVDIYAGIDMAKSTVRDVLNYLIEARLVVKTGERGGYGLTAEGRALSHKLSLNQ